MSQKRTRHTRLIRHDRLLGAFAAVAQAVSQTLDLEQLLDIALAKVMEVMNADLGAIYLIDREKKQAVLKAHRGYSEGYAQEMGTIDIGEEVERRVAGGEPLFDVQKILGERNLARMMSVIEKEGIKSYAPAALWAKGVLHGSLFVGTRHRREFSPEDIDLLNAIGNQIAVAIENAELFEQTRARVEELRESEERLRAVIENAPDAIFVNDLAGNYIDENGQAEVLTGYSKEELIGKNFAEVGWLSEEYLLKAMAVQEKNVRGEATGPDEFELIRKDGSRVSVEVTSFPVARKGKVEVVTIARDITDRKKAEESLRLYQDIVNNTQIGLSVYHLEDIDYERTLRLVGTNPAARQITGTRDEIVGKTIAEATPGLLETPFPKNLAEVVRSGKARDLGETRYGDQRLAEAVFSVKAFPLPNNHVGVAFEDVTERKRAEEEILRHTERLAVTAQLTHIIVSSLNIEDVYEAFVAGVRRLVDFDRASIALVEGDRVRFLVVSSEVETSVGTGTTMPLKETATGWVVTHKKTNIEADLAKNRQFPIDEAYLRSGLRSAIRLPLFSRGGVIGTFNLSSCRPNAFGPREQEMLEELAGQIAVAIENYRLYEELKHRKEDLEGAYEQLVGITRALERSKEELEEAYLKMARTLVLTLEARDPYTRGHSERVAQLSRQIAFEMNLSSEEVKKIETAARLHDLGKIGIPDGILLKPGSLTPSERAEIQLHPTKSVDMLRLLGFLDGTLPIIEGHHERYDGGGYPDGRKGEETPLGGRILAVSDAYDAMTSARPYRPAMTSEQATKILREGAGSQWDPKVVDAFLRTFGQSLSERGNAD